MNQQREDAGDEEEPRFRGRRPTGGANGRVQRRPDEDKRAGGLPHEQDGSDDSPGDRTRDREPRGSLLPR